MKLDVDEICRTVLAGGADEGSVEREVLRTCAQLYPGQGRAAARSVMEMIDSFASRFGGSRLAAVRRLAESDAVVVTETYGSLDDMPAEMRERVARMVEDGNTGMLRHVTVRHADGTTGDLPPDVLEEIGRARAAHGGTLPPGFRIRRRLTPWWRPWLMLGIILLVVLGIAGLQLLSGIREIEKTRGLGAQAARIAELEEVLAEEPDDVDAARELAGLYANRLITIRSLLALRDVSLDGAGGAEGLDAAKEDRIAAYEAGMKITANSAELERLAMAGLEMTDRVLAETELTEGDRGTFQVVRGYCLLALDRRSDAQEASEAAAAIDGRDVRPHLLNAAICEQTRDYAGAVQELETARRKLSAWVREGPSLLQEFVWGLGPTPATDRREWERRRDNIARRVGDSIQARLIILRTLSRAQERGIEV